MKARLLAFALALVCLTGCAPLLEREYNTVEPHSSKFWESEAADTLRAENYQDLVNDYNRTAVPYKKIGMVRIRKEEFPKNTLRKIVRFRIDHSID